MHINSVLVERPISRRTMRQALLLTAGSVLALTLVSFVVARHFLLDRARLHVTTLLQVAAEQVEQEVASGRNRSRTEPARLLSSASFLQRMQAAAYGAGSTTEILLGRVLHEDLELIRLASPDGSASIILGKQDDQLQYGLALAAAAAGRETIGSSEDYRGQQVMTASRFLPSLGWGISVQIDAREVLAGVRLLALFHALLGIGLVLLASAASLWLSRSWTTPIRSLAQRVATLSPGNWNIAATLNSRDEVALLERVFVDMASRLKALYENLEDLVEERTQDLREQFELDRAVLENMEHAVIVTDRHGVVTSLNPAAETILGKKEAECIGVSATALLPLYEKGELLTDTAHPVLHALTHRSSARPTPGTSWTYGSGTDQKAVYLIATPLLSQNEVFGVVIVFQDVTKERQMEQLKSEFITLASHQMRTPLSIVQWQMESLKDPEATADSKGQALAEVERAATRMTTITNAMLQVAKLEGGALTPAVSDVDVSELLKNTLEGVIDGNARHLKVETIIPDRCMLSTDPVLFAITLQNLLENAIKYSPDGGTLRIACTATNESVSISIADEGMGIPAAEQRHVFEKFFRGQNVKKLSTDGTGLGLYIANMIVGELGGTLTFNSKEGKGTTFTVILPKSVKTTA